LGKLSAGVVCASDGAETSGQSNEPGFLAIKAQQLETEWEVHHWRVLLEALRVAGTRELKRCEQSCRALRHVLCQQEDLRPYERETRELDNTKDQIMILLKVRLANLGLWVRDVRRVGAYEILAKDKGG
jgi:hypothetical protein